jgi:hypothetical protein
LGKWQMPASNAELARKLAALENKSDAQFTRKIAVSMKRICCDNLMLISNREHFISHF